MGFNVWIQIGYLDSMQVGFKGLDTDKIHTLDKDVQRSHHEVIAEV